jgi:site-specific recombinase XerC
MSRTRSAGHAAPHVLFTPDDARRGAARVQELAGHRDFGTTQRYMHLSPAAVRSAIRLLEALAPRAGFGDILETEDPGREKMNG